MSYPIETINAAKLATVEAVNDVLAWVDRLNTLTRTNEAQVAALTAERDSARAAAAAAEGERDQLADSLDVVTADRDQVRAELALYKPAGGRVSAEPARDLLQLVKVRVALAGDVVRSKWAAPLALAEQLLNDAAAAGGIRVGDPRLAALVAAAAADALVSAEELVAAGLLPSA